MDIFSWTSFLPLFFRRVQGTKRTNQEQRLYTQRSVKTRLSIVRVVWMCVNGMLVWTWVTDYSVCLCECVLCAVWKYVHSSETCCVCVSLCLSLSISTTFVKLFEKDGSCYIFPIVHHMTSNYEEVTGRQASFFAIIKFEVKSHHKKAESQGPQFSLVSFKGGHYW